MGSNRVTLRNDWRKKRNRNTKAFVPSLFLRGVGKISPLMNFSCWIQQGIHRPTWGNLIMTHRNWPNFYVNIFEAQNHCNHRSFCYLSLPISGVSNLFPSNQRPDGSPDPGKSNRSKSSALTPEPLKQAHHRTACLWCSAQLSSKPYFFSTWKKGWTHQNDDVSVDYWAKNVRIITPHKDLAIFEKWHSCASLREFAQRAASMPPSSFLGTWINTSTIFLRDSSGKEAGSTNMKSRIVQQKMTLDDTSGWCVASIYVALCLCIHCIRIWPYMYVIMCVHNCMFWDSDKKYQEAGEKNTIHKFRILTKQIWVPLLHFILSPAWAFPT